MIEDTIRTAVAESGKSQRDLAKLSGISQVAVSKFLRGMHLSGDKLEHLAIAAGVRIEVKRKGRQSSPAGPNHQNSIQENSE